MKQNSKLLKALKVTKSIFRWLGFTAFELVLTVLNLSFLVAIAIYLSYSFGSQERIEADDQNVSIKKVDGFYMIQGEEYGYYSERTFPNCKIKFYNKVLEFRNGDVYDGKTKVTNKVSIEKAGHYFRVYYLNKSYPLTTLNKFDGSYKIYFGKSPKNYRITEKKDMYASNGVFYIDVDERHEIRNFFFLLVVLVIIFFARLGFAEITRNLFEKEYNCCYDVIWGIIGKINSGIKKENNE